MSTMRVSEKTRLRILAAAEELGYTPNPVAQALRRKRSNVLGFVPRSNRLNPYDSPVPFLLAVHLTHAGSAHGYHFVTANPETPDHDNTDRLIQFLIGRHVDGIVLDSPPDPAEVARLVERGIPVVQMIRPQTDVPTSTVTIDPASGTAEAIEHLLAEGHHEIGFIGTGGDHPVDRVRLDTFRATLRTAEITPREEWTILVDAYSTAHGLLGAQELMRQSELPTAIFVTGDNLAAGALQHLYEREIRVPDHLSVISYDDIYAGHLSPPLTSVNQPLQEAASRAVAMLARQIEGPAEERAEPGAVVLPSRLVVRGSVRRLSLESQGVPV